MLCPRDLAAISVKTGPCWKVRTRVRSVMQIRQQEAKGLHSQSRCRLVNMLTGRCTAAGSMRSIEAVGVMCPG